MASLFAAALAIGLLTRLWLASRQMRHVALHRDAVPDAFANTVSLAAHQKAAAYTLAKSRLGLLEMAFGTAVLLGWTLLGGLGALNQAVFALLGPDTTPLVSQLVLLAAFALVGGLLDLPFTLYQTFVVEARFGFNKTTPALWLTDLVKSVLIAVP